MVRLPKTCKSCNRTFPVARFPVTHSNERPMRRATRCLKCYRAYRNDLVKNRLATDPSFAQKRREINRGTGRRRLARGGWLNNKARAAAYLLEHPCVDCGEADINVLHFDHVRGNKTDNISRMLRNNKAWSKVRAEIRKCDVRCANCHMRRTVTQFGWNRFGLVRERKDPIRPRTSYTSRKPPGRFRGAVQVPSGKWRCTVNDAGRCRHIGTFDTEFGAAMAYNAFAYRLRGDRAKLNNVAVELRKDFPVAVRVERS